MAQRVFRHVVWDDVEPRLVELGIGMDDPRVMAIDYYLGTTAQLDDARAVPGAVAGGRQVLAYRTKPYMGRPLLAYFVLGVPEDGRVMESANVLDALGPAAN